jgi:hypothetical protein
VHPGVFAAKEPERPAVIMGTAGTVLTYAELEARSNQVAWLARRFTTGELRTPVGKIRRGPLREQFGAAPGPYRPRSGGIHDHEAFGTRRRISRIHCALRAGRPTGPAFPGQAGYHEPGRRQDPRQQPLQPRASP